MHHLSTQVLSIWLAVWHRVDDAVAHARSDDRGELTGNVILLAALAVAAAAVGAIIVAKLNGAANSVPGG